jgi:acetyl esterase/lipase
MSKIQNKQILQGRLNHKLRSLAVLTKLSAHVALRRALGKPLAPEWSFEFEVGVLFIRAQFNHAFAMGDFAQGRAYFDSLRWQAQPVPKVDVRASTEDEPQGHWFIPQTRTREATMLYFHGGGYSFYAAVTRDFIAMLAETLGMAIFASDYRLTPEHPHPAQIDDALAAYRYLLDKGHDPSRLIVGGDSAGGHLVLMTMVKLRDLGLPQPAIGIGISPWTDTRPRGASLFGNDRYDLVQGYMTNIFATWLKGRSGVSDTELSPISQDLHGLAPLYLQAGGKEILFDMIRDFAQVAQTQGATIRLDVWEHMTHEFQSMGESLPESHEALQRIDEAIGWALDPDNRKDKFPPCARTEVNAMPNISSQPTAYGGG